MLDQVQHHLSKKKCVTQLEDVLSLLDFGKTRLGYSYDAEHAARLKKMKTSKEVHGGSYVRAILSDHQRCHDGSVAAIHGGHVEINSNLWQRKHSSAVG